MYTCPNDSIIVINYSARVISTIWESLKVFSCFDEWISFTQPSDTLILFTHLPHIQTNVPLTHIRITTHIQLTHLSTTHTPLLHIPQTQLSLTRIQRSIKCHSHTYHVHKYINVTQLYIIGFWVPICHRTVFKTKKYLFLNELEPDTQTVESEINCLGIRV